MLGEMTTGNWIALASVIVAAAGILISIFLKKSRLHWPDRITGGRRGAVAARARPYRARFGCGVGTRFLTVAARKAASAGSQTIVTHPKGIGVRRKCFTAICRFRCYGVTQQADGSNRADGSIYAHWWVWADCLGVASFPSQFGCG